MSHDVQHAGAGVAFTDDALVVATPVATAAGTPAGSARWQVSATDVVTGAARWTYTTPDTDVGQEDGNDPVGSTYLSREGDRLVLTVRRHAWILGPDGSLVRDVPLDRGSWLESARSGAFLVNSTGSAQTAAGTLLLADGTEVPIDETAGWLSVDDGSAPDVVVTVGQGLTGAHGISGRDASTGRSLWHLDEPITAALLLEGTLYLASDRRLQAIDATTGHEHWSSDLDFQPQQLSTDGRYLLVPGPAVTLNALAMSDGAPPGTRT